MSECTMICLDNSEWMRNGDYSRTRFEAQHEGAHCVLGYKSQNPESTVGVISLAGGKNVGVQVLCSPTDEKIKVMRAFATAKIGGKADLSTGLRVAQLALKYRPAHFKPRIVVFIGSPIEEESRKKLLKVAKELKKVNVAVDVISMGEWDSNEQILNEFINTVQKNDSSNLIVVPPGTFPEDAINASPIGGGNQFAEFGGVNPEMEPELAAAMQESLLLAQQEAANRNAAAGNAGAKEGGSGTTTNEVEYEEDDEEETALLAKAMEMSKAEGDKEGDSKKEKEKGSSSQMLNPNFLKSLVTDIQGVDMDSDEIQSLLKDAEEKKDEDSEGKDKKKKKNP